SMRADYREGCCGIGSRRSDEKVVQGPQTACSLSDLRYIRAAIFSRRLPSACRIVPILLCVSVSTFAARPATPEREEIYRSGDALYVPPWISKGSALCSVCPCGRKIGSLECSRSIGAKSGRFPTNRSRWYATSPLRPLSQRGYLANCASAPKR